MPAALSHAPVAAPAAAPAPNWRMRWGRLPRDSRDTLFLLAVVAWTLLPHVTSLPLWCSLMSAGVLVWRARLAWRQGPLPRRAWLLVFLIASLALTLWSHRSLIGREAGVTLLVVLTALKTLELRARRDAFVIFFLGFFLVLTQFVRSQSLVVGLMMLVSVWGLLTGLVLAHMPVGQPALARAGRLAARNALLGVPIMLVLFLLFPRIGPLWGQPDQGKARTGLSNSLQLGQIAELAQDESPAMRLRILGGALPDPRQLYFRGPVLGAFDGQQWSVVPPSTSGVLAGTPVRTAGAALDYELMVEPQGLGAIPLLEATPALPEMQGAPRGTWLTPGDDLQWRANRMLNERVSYRARAWLSFSHGPVSRDETLEPYLALPRLSNPRTQEWARALRREPRYARAEARTLALALLQHIRGSDYVYTLSPGEYGTQAIDEFWLDRREGFCEHYAASFVLIMRAMGVPARIVTGYQGAESNPIDGSFLVRQSYAHAWAEYWQEGSGWLRADPTNAVAPERIEGTLPPLRSQSLVARALNQMQPGLWVRSRAFWDALNGQWDRWVLNYGTNKQRSLLESLGIEQVDPVRLITLLGALLAAAAGAGALWALAEQRRMDPWLRQWHRVLLALHRAGIDLPASTPPLRVAELLGETANDSHRRAAHAELSQQLARLSALRYAQSPEPSTRAARELSTRILLLLQPWLKPDPGVRPGDV